MRATARFLTGAVLAVALAACSEDGTGPDGGGNGNQMAATVPGETFNPSPPLGSVVATRAGNNLTVVGTSNAGGKSVTIQINLLNVTDEDDYPVTPAVGLSGQFAQLVIVDGSVANTKTWTTILAPGTGNVEITTLTADRVAGNFFFTGQTAGPPATGQMTVTSGSFDAEF